VGGEGVGQGNFQGSGHCVLVLVVLEALAANKAPASQCADPPCDGDDLATLIFGGGGGRRRGQRAAAPPTPPAAAKGRSTSKKPIKVIACPPSKCRRCLWVRPLLFVAVVTQWVVCGNSQIF
jgi:hypothetical protein